ncbi:MAG TPA: hypothetical protein DD638_04640 [Pasteurellaceae bacterium]|nr:hypothetical protein [Pasteurellaceae bacterium]
MLLLKSVLVQRWCGRRGSLQGKFKLNNVDLTVTPISCCCYGSETMESHMPKAIWELNGTECPRVVILHNI